MNCFLLFLFCSVSVCTLMASTSFADVGDDWTLDQIPAGSTVTLTEVVNLPPAQTDGAYNGGTELNHFCTVFAKTGDHDYQIPNDTTFSITKVNVNSGLHDSYDIILDSALGLEIHCDNNGNDFEIGSVNASGNILINVAQPKPFPN